MCSMNEKRHTSAFFSEGNAHFGELCALRDGVLIEQC